jgi:hypothetical protein
MRSNLISDKEWITLKEASKITGRSIQALRLLINRKKIDKVKKVQDNGPGYWLIHKDALGQISMISMGDKDTYQENISHTYQVASQVISIPIEYYEQQQKERDQLQAGLMMYRYKFEELDKQMKLLPAPVEIVSTKLKEQEAMIQTKDQALSRAQEILDKAREDYDQYKTAIIELKEKLQEEERVKAGLRQQLEIEQRPWWKKVLGLK